MDGSTASWRVLFQGVNEQETIDAEYRLIGEAMEDSNCINKQKGEKRSKAYWVYVIQSEKERKGKKGKALPGFFYVGMTTDPARRLREHNGLYKNGTKGNPNGGKYTSQHRPWKARALYGPYKNRSEALKAEYALKRKKRGEGRTRWTPKDHALCRGEGAEHVWVNNPTWTPDQ